MKWVVGVDEATDKAMMKWYSHILVEPLCDLGIFTAEETCLLKGLDLLLEAQVLHSFEFQFRRDGTATAGFCGQKR